LYQWAEAVQYQNGASNTTLPSPAFSGYVKGICPTGWHIPSDIEWDKLISFLGNVAISGNSVKSLSSLWLSTSGNTNRSGFSALPGGKNGGIFGFNYIRTYTSFWSYYANNSSSSSAGEYLLNYNQSVFRLNNTPKSVGNSVRCLKD
jgi:uncharacterized protein (TIGR02145 family)